MIKPLFSVEKGDFWLLQNWFHQHVNAKALVTVDSVHNVNHYTKFDAYPSTYKCKKLLCIFFIGMHTVVLTACFWGQIYFPHVYLCKEYVLISLACNTMLAWRMLSSCDLVWAGAFPHLLLPCPFPSLFFALFIFSRFLSSSALPLFFYCPFLSFLPESPHQNHPTPFPGRSS